MKKYFLVTALIFFAASVLPQTVKAQWTNPYSTYRTNDLIRRTPKKTAVKKNSAKSVKPKPVGAKRKAVRPVAGKKRKVAAVENVILPKVFDIAPPKRIYAA